ncbi:MAG TPA: DedA family protein [Bryobacteraceae bacterium]|nr:DedA family protein [Bryobacteraceae bacterium]
MQHVDLFLAHYGYLAIFGLLMLGIVGPLIPDETILVLAGAAVHAGRLAMVPAIGAAFAGSLCGITLSYTLGRTGAVLVLEKFGPFQRHVGSQMPKVHEWFERYGKWALFFGYFVAGIRHFTALAAGIGKLEWHEFALFAYPGGLLWVVSFVATGYFVGEEWETLRPLIERYILGAVAVALVAAVAIWFLRRRPASKN